MALPTLARVQGQCLTQKLLGEAKWLHQLEGAPGGGGIRGIPGHGDHRKLGLGVCHPLGAVNVT